MPVIKYKTFEEAEKVLWCFEPNQEYFKRVEKLFKTASALCKTKYPKGVYKYKTFEDAERDMEKWRRANY